MTTAPTPLASSAPASTKAAKIGQIVYFSADHDQLGGMKRIDEDEPFAAIVACALNDRLVNILAIDHNGTTFAFQRVPLFQGDDRDDKKAPWHCDFDAPEPKKTVVISGAAGQPIPLGLDANVARLVQKGISLESVKLTFTVPDGNKYEFASEKAQTKQSFFANKKPQTLTVTPDQIALGALSDLTINVANPGDVSLAGTYAELGAPDRTGKIHTFTENVVVGPPAPEPKAAAKPAPIEPAPVSAMMPPPVSPAPAAQQAA